MCPKEKKSYNRLAVSKRRTVHLLSEYFVKPTNHFSKNQKLNNLFREWNTKFTTDESSLGPPFNYALKHLEHLYRFLPKFQELQECIFSYFYCNFLKARFALD